MCLDKRQNKQECIQIGGYILLWTIHNYAVYLLSCSKPLKLEDSIFFLYGAKVRGQYILPCLYPPAFKILTLPLPYRDNSGLCPWARWERSIQGRIQIWWRTYDCRLRLGQGFDVLGDYIMETSGKYCHIFLFFPFTLLFYHFLDCTLPLFPHFPFLTGLRKFCQFILQYIQCISCCLDLGKHLSLSFIEIILLLYWISYRAEWQSRK